MEILTEQGTTEFVYIAITMHDKSSEGGAIVWNGMAGTVKDCIFRDNGVDFSNLGGAIYWRGDCGKVIGSEGTLTSSILLNEYADERNVYEDELLWWEGDNATITNSLLIDAVIQSSNVSCDYNCWGDTIQDSDIITKPSTPKSDGLYIWGSKCSLP